MLGHPDPLLERARNAGGLLIRPAKLTDRPRAGLPMILGRFGGRAADAGAGRGTCSASQGCARAQQAKP